MEVVTLSIWEYDQIEVAHHILTKFIPQHPNFIDSFNFEVVPNRLQVGHFFSHTGRLPQYDSGLLP